MWKPLNILAMASIAISVWGGAGQARSEEVVTNLHLVEDGAGVISYDAPWATPFTTGSGSGWRVNSVTMLIHAMEDTPSMSVALHSDGLMANAVSYMETRCYGDADYSGSVDFEDIVETLSHWSSTCH